jgi:hypothetical protein
MPAKDVLIVLEKLNEEAIQAGERGLLGEKKDKLEMLRVWCGADPAMYLTAIPSEPIKAAAMTQGMALGSLSALWKCLRVRTRSPRLFFPNI